MARSDTEIRWISRREFVRFAGLLGLSGATVPTTGVMPARAQTAAKPTGEITIVQGVDAESLDPMVTTNAGSRSMMLGMFDTLIWLDETLTPQPSLALSWSHPNEATWRLRLRQGVRFHDGSPFNADTAKFSIDRFFDPDTKNPQAGDFRSAFKETRVVDEHTIDVVTNGPYPAFPNAQFTIIMMSPSSVKAAGAEVAKKPVGTGQYRFVEWVPGERLVMEANPDYWGPKARVQRLVWKPIAEASTRIVALRTGQADLIANVPPQLAGQLAEPDLRLERVPGIIVTVMFNLAVKPFDQLKVRQAVNHAVNVDEIVQFVLGGAATRLASATKPGMLGHDPELRPYSYDPAQARKLLAEAGYPNGFEAVLDAPNGRYLNDKAVAEAVAGQLAKVGVTVKVNIPDYPTLVRKIVKKESQFYLIGTVEPATEIAFPRAFRPAGVFNQGYQNTEVQELMERANRTLDRAERDRMFRQVNRQVQRDCPWLFLYAQQDTFGLRARLQGFQTRSDAYVIVRNFWLKS
jgi:peptide/nickel transport system substrate-binding protein